MKFSTDFLDEIRARVPVSQVVGARVKLKKSGREWAGLSPFNAEKTPSFFVNDQKGFYHDFSSGKHGDVFTFLMETEGLGFPEAVEKVAAMAGLPMPARSREGEARDQRRAVLRDALVLAAEIFESTLNAPVGAKARGYLSDRGVDPAAQRLFGLGYSAPDRFALREALAARGVDLAEMIAAGLLAHGEDVAVAYDRFRDRVMFPIHDRGGKLVAFGGRALDPSAKAKYLNSPESELFHKGELLYNHHRARKAAHERGEVIVVEGYVDVIAMTQAGFAHTVAPLGTALTSEQCALLWTIADEPILCFDGDKAGRKAAYRAIDVALPLIGPGKSLRFAMLPEGQDPDDLARSGGAPAIAEALRAAEPLAELLFARETEGHAFDTPEKRAGLERRLRELVGQIADETLRRHYAADMARAARRFLRRRRARRRRVAAGASATSAAADASAVRTPGRGSASPAPRCRPRRAASSPAPRGAARDRHSGDPDRPSRAARKARRGGGGARIRSAPPSPPSATGCSACPAEAFAGAEALASALAAAGLAADRERILSQAAGTPNWWCVGPRRKSRTPNTFCARLWPCNGVRGR